MKYFFKNSIFDKDIMSIFTSFNHYLLSNFTFFDSIDDLKILKIKKTIQFAFTIILYLILYLKLYDKLNILHTKFL